MFQARRLFADDATVVSIVHTRIGWMPTVDRRIPHLNRQLKPL